MSDPQTIVEVQDLLSRHHTEPNRKLGQNFLVDPNLMRLVVSSAELDAECDVVLEVGAGTGSLTQMLADAASRVVTVETDKKLIPVLDEVLGRVPNVTLLVRDALARKHAVADEVLEALQRELAAVPGARLKLVANLPYAVATPLVANLLLSPPRPELMVFTVQKEVADRIAAPADTHDYGPVSILAQATSRVELLRDLSPNVFWPKPQVHSTLVRLRVDEERIAALPPLGLLQRVAAGLFAHRRKTCLKSLQTTPELADLKGRWAELLEAADIDPRTRGDTLGLDQVIALARAVERAT